MRFIYATRPMPSLEFGIAKQRESMPSDAEVYAMCDRALTIRQQNKVGQLTAAEQSRLHELITESQLAEEVDARNFTPAGGYFRRLVRRLLSRVTS